MTLLAFTIVLNGQPWIEKHLPVLEATGLNWQWFIAEGASDNNEDTKWCQPQSPATITDGTLEYLRVLRNHPRVRVMSKPLWHSKRAMCNQALDSFTTPGVLLQLDSDELHATDNLRKIVSLFQSDPTLGAIRMPCRFFVGPKLICRGENVWSNRGTEWERAWRYQPGMRWLRHEPPGLTPAPAGRIMSRQEAATHGLTFDHMAYVSEEQCAFKESFYGYTGLVRQWRALQEYPHLPAPLNRFFPWIKPNETPEVVKA